MQNLLIIRPQSSWVIAWIFPVIAVFKGAMVQRLPMQKLLLRNLQRKTSGGFRSIEWGYHFNSVLCLMRRFPNFSRNHSVVTLAVWGILLDELFFLLIKILPLFKFYPSLERNSIFSFSLSYPDHLQRKMLVTEPCFEMTIYAVYFLNAKGIRWQWGFSPSKNIQFLELTWPFKKSGFLIIDLLPHRPRHDFGVFD